ncbi:MAG TPA: serine hydrolase [Streptosporangiaceae bacterium]|nr:serine hydrolase [Streptosporangiaceae bacterium]
MPYSARLTALAAVAGILCAGLAGCAAPDSAPRASASSPNAVTSSPSATPGPAGMQAVQTATSPRRVKATGGALADTGTMQLLWGRQLNTERPIGSITKVMTALLVIEAGDLNRKIRIPKAVIAYVAKYQGESAGLHPGDVLTARQLLEALLLQSGCDAAYVLATAYGPGMPAFLAKMNAQAAQLGMRHTHFTSPDGLPYPTEYSTYSTPADLLTLGMAAMKLPVFRAIVGQRFYHTARRKGHHHAYWWDNTNGLIGTYRGADGIKTGYTDAAKHCLLFEAVRHGKILIGDVLGSPTTGPDSAAQAAARLLNWGFGLNSSA